jgi:hypothetical protein
VAIKFMAATNCTTAATTMAATNCSMATKWMAAECTAAKWMASKCTAAKWMAAECTAARCTAAKPGLDRFAGEIADSASGGETAVHKQRPALTAAPGVINRECAARTANKVAIASRIDASDRLSYTPASFDPRQSARTISGPFSYTVRLLSEPRHIVVNR